LLKSQERSLLEQISIPAGIAASVLSIFAFLQLPSSRDLVFVAYFVVILILVGGPVIERKFFREDGLDDVVYLGIYFDEAAKYVNEMTLAKCFGSSDAINDFIEDTRDALQGTLSFLKEKIDALKSRKQYPSCLSDIGRSETWVRRLDEDIRSVLGRGIFE